MSRDMSRQQFGNAARAQGFRLGPLGLTTEHGVDGLWTSYGYIMHKTPQGWKVHGRASLAKAMRLREEDIKRGAYK